jgi:DUF1009 family protein
MLFDVPVAGPATIETMLETHTTVMALDAGRTLLIDKDEMLRRADDHGLSVVGYLPEGEGK